MEIHLSDWEPLQGECSNHGSHEYHLGNFLNSPGSTGTPYQLYQKLCGWESDICYFSNSLHDYHIQPSSRVTAWQCHWLRNCHLGESLNSGFCSAGKLQSGHPEAGLERVSENSSRAVRSPSQHPPLLARKSPLLHYSLSRSSISSMAFIPINIHVIIHFLKPSDYHGGGGGQFASVVSSWNTISTEIFGSWLNYIFT